LYLFLIHVQLSHENSSDISLNWSSFHSQITCCYGDNNMSQNRNASAYFPFVSNWSLFKCGIFTCSVPTLISFSLGMVFYNQWKNTVQLETMYCHCNKFISSKLSAGWGLYLDLSMKQLQLVLLSYIRCLFSKGFFAASQILMSNAECQTPNAQFAYG